GQAGGKFEAITVTCTKLSTLIKKYQIPHYLKCDIEGGDLEALCSLQKEQAPCYISVELSLDDGFIPMLATLGYTRFKLVNGVTFTTSDYIKPQDYGWRVVRKSTKLFPLLERVLHRLPQPCRPKIEFDPQKYSPGGYKFSRACSGPFGEDA